MIEHIKVAKFRFTCAAGPGGLRLPPYKGSTLRGGFGNAFKRITCYQPNVKSCNKCLVHSRCPYGYIFETAPKEGAEKLRNLESIPRPFVIEPPLESKEEYQPGEILHFNLILMGKAIEYLPYFVITFEEMGRLGIGKGRNPFILKEIETVNPLSDKKETIFSATNRNLTVIDLSVTGELLREHISKSKEMLNNDIKELTLKFETMTRLKFDGGFVLKPEFHVLIRNFLRRLSTISYFHHDYDMDIDFKGFIERSKEIKIKDSKVKWVDWERYSARQDDKMKLGGTVGEICYEGENLTDFLPLLKLGEIIHIGKGTVFGLGKYRIEAIAP